MALKNFPYPLLNRFWANNRLLFISSILVTAVILRIILNVVFPRPLDADECAEILMAMDLLQDPRFIVGWMGQNYMGSLEIYLLSIWGTFFGWSVISIRLIMALLVLSEIVILYWIASRVYQKSAGAFTMLAILTLSSPVFYDWGLRARSYQLSIVLMLVALFIATGLWDAAGILEEKPYGVYNSVEFLSSPHTGDRPYPSCSWPAPRSRGSRSACC